jgi:hypothetical protein
MLVIIATTTISLAIGLWIGTFHTKVQCDKRMQILVEIINKNALSRITEDPDELDRFLDNMRRGEVAE